MAKHFISVLGTSTYTECIYFQEDKEVQTAFIQEASLEICFEEVNEDDKITIFITESAKVRNWENRKYSQSDIDNLNDKINPPAMLGRIE